ncbi:MAG TPA: glycosyltransferase family 4 protein [Candidatus Binatus sp.]|nr:glycosyltransferase family 4 protein [Candidatus Binatus sp.]
MRSLRLGIVTSGFPYTDKEAFLAPEIQTLADSDLDVSIYPTNPKYASARHRFPGRSLPLPLGSAHTLAQALLELITRFGRTMRALRVVMTNGSLRIRAKNATVFLKALAVARDMRRHGIEHVHAYWASTPATVAHIVSMLNDVPWSFTAHRWDIYEDNMLAEKIRHARFARVISQRGRTDILGRIDAQAEKVRALHLGVDEPGPLYDAISGELPCTIICAANLVPVKGHAVLIEALRLALGRGVSFRCVFAGDGPLRSELSRAIDNAGLAEFVTLPGVISHERLLAELAIGIYDIAALASVEKGDLHEGLPAFLMEAMAAGVPCVATRTGSIDELIGADVGLLVPQQDAQALSHALETLARDPDLRRTLGRAARRRVDEGFLATKTARQLLEWIQGEDSAHTRRATSEATLARS